VLLAKFAYRGGKGFLGTSGVFELARNFLFFCTVGQVNELSLKHGSERLAGLNHVPRNDGYPAFDLAQGKRKDSYSNLMI
jgi:hypothetical protein